MSESELAAVLEDLIYELGDAHAYIESDDNSFFAMNNIKWEKFRTEVLEKRFAEQNEFTSLREFHRSLYKKRDAIIATYFDNSYKTEQLNRSMLWAMLPNNVAYLSIDDMSDYTKEETALADIAEVDRALNSILPILEKANGLVIDLRWNSGGYDVVSQRILSHLIDAISNR